jgi:hypothetical protein
VAALYAFLATLRTDGSFEGLFYDWFGGQMSEARAFSGPRAGSYIAPPFIAFHDLLKTYDTAAPEKLDHPRFKQADPETLLIDEIEAIWAQIALEDDWAPFEAKLAAMETYRQALPL